MEKIFNQVFQSAYVSYLSDEGMPPEIIETLVKNNDVTSTKFADFQFNGIMRIFKGLKEFTKNPATVSDVASNIIDRVNEYFKNTQIIQTIKHDKNFINITMSNTFILNTVINYGSHLIKNGPKHYGMCNIQLNAKTENNKKQRIVADYSSPNVAKSLHIGHLRSTVIGETIVRLLLNEGHEVIGLNHVGDWGTQFGMIINYLKKMYSSDHDLMAFIGTANSKDLMDIYRNAKKEFDSDKTFANESRDQTYKLQQGDSFNTKIWKAICEISSKEYSDIYKLLNVQYLTERGESFYQLIIPDVLKMLEGSGLLINENGATIIKLDNWSYPLMVVKSDGGYTYDTTDLAALYHRLLIMKADSIIYITDAGQKTHFDMCFDVANKMGWTRSESNDLKKLTHIGFGLVLGKDGTKLKTRSGDVVKMLDVIDDVVILSRNIINERIKKCNTLSSDKTLDTDPTSIYYQNISDTDIVKMSQRIGLNTLKYFDLSHRFETNYKYDPDLMFRFTGDTGVYLMYCFARINGIIEKSTIVADLNLKRNNVSSIQLLFDKLDLVKIDDKYFTKETRELMIHIMNFDTYLDRAVANLNTVDLTKYLYSLCTYFNTFISQKNGKIIGSTDETIGIVLCLIVSKIIECVFNLLSFEPVDHI